MSTEERPSAGDAGQDATSKPATFAAQSTATPEGLRREDHRGLLDRFVGARFVLSVVFLGGYYTQMWLPDDLPVPRLLLLSVLIVLLSVGVLANLLWGPDFGKRLESGIRRLVELSGAARNSSASLAETDMLEHVRWTNAKILGVVVIILGVLAQYEHFDKIPAEHQVPALLMVVLILASLFDSALDLEAEWTITLLCAALEVKTHRLPHALWYTNQFRQAQRDLWDKVSSGHALKERPPFTAFTATAQSLVAFASVMVSFVLAMSIYGLFPRWLTVAREVLGWGIFG